MKNKKPVGFLGEADIVGKVVAEGLDPENVKAEQIMLVPPPVVNAEAGLPEIAKLMAETGVRRVLVMKDDEMLGTVTAGDILKVVSYLSFSEVRKMYERIQREI